jgi:hypothetical protein
MDANSIVSDIKDLVEAAAIAVAGIWAAYTFHKLQTARAAETDIRRMESEINKAESDIRKGILEAEKNSAEIAESGRRLLSQQPNLEISFGDIAEHHIANAGIDCLVIPVTLRNSGVRNLWVEFSRHTLTVGRFESANMHATRLLDAYGTAPQYVAAPGQMKNMPERVFRVEQSRQLAFVAPVPSAGLYLLQFEATYSPAPFEGENAVQEAMHIQAIEQRIVAVAGS